MNRLSARTPNKIAQPELKSVRLDSFDAEVVAAERMKSGARGQEKARVVGRVTDDGILTIHVTRQAKSELVRQHGDWSRQKALGRIGAAKMQELQNSSELTTVEETLGNELTGKAVAAETAAKITQNVLKKSPVGRLTGRALRAKELVKFHERNKATVESVVARRRREVVVKCQKTVVTIAREMADRVISDAQKKTFGGTMKVLSGTVDNRDSSNVDLKEASNDLHALLLEVQGVEYPLTKEAYDRRNADGRTGAIFRPVDPLAKAPRQVVLAMLEDTEFVATPRTPRGAAKSDGGAEELFDLNDFLAAVVPIPPRATIPLLQREDSETAVEDATKTNVPTMEDIEQLHAEVMALSARESLDRDSKLGGRVGHKDVVDAKLDMMRNYLAQDETGRSPLRVGRAAVQPKIPAPGATAEKKVAVGNNPIKKTAPGRKLRGGNGVPLRSSVAERRKNIDSKKSLRSPFDQNI